MWIGNTTYTPVPSAPHGQTARQPLRRRGVTLGKRNLAFVQHAVILVALIIIFSTAASCTVAAQASYTSFPDANNPSGPPGPLQEDNIWKVDPLTGAVTVKIPITTLPVNGRGPKVPYYLQYNSSATVELLSSSGGTPVTTLMSPFTQSCNTENEPTASLHWASNPQFPSVWTVSGPSLTAVVSQIRAANPQTACQTLTTPACTIQGRFFYTDESGASHDLNLAEVYKVSTSNLNPLCSRITDTPTGATLDGSAIYSSNPNDTNVYPSGPPANAAVTIDASGTQFIPGIPSSNEVTSTLEDTNGNSATVTSFLANSNGADFLEQIGAPSTVKDSLGRTLFTSTFNPQQFNPGSSYTIATTGADGQAQTYTVQTGSVVPGAFSMPRPVASDWLNVSIYSDVNNDPVQVTVNSAVAANAIPVIASITLPNTTSYQFSYDSTYATISKIIFPTGGYVQFQWGIRNVGTSTANIGAESTLVVTEASLYSGSGQVSQWQYSYSDLDTSTGTMTSTESAPDGTTTTFTATPVYFSKIWVGGAPTFQETLRTITNSGGTLIKSVATKYSSGGLDSTGGNSGVYPLPSQIATTYYDGTSPLQQQVDFTYDAYDNITEKDESDFYTCSGDPCTVPSSPPSGWLRKTLTTYYWSAYPAYQTAHIVNKTYTATVTDGSGNPVAETQYDYDQSAPTPHGNLVSEKKCQQFSGTSCSSWLPATTHQYDSQGELISTTDSNGNTTAYTWTNGYMTKITRPVVNGIAHIEQYSYNAYTGQKASFTDENSQKIGYSYTDPSSGVADPLNRLRRVTLPSTSAGTGYTQYNYDDAPGAWTVTEQQLMNSANQLKTHVYSYDGLGRLVTAELASDPVGSDIVNTTYDLLGRISSTTNPYRCTCDVTYGVTSYGYDALGRKTSQTQPDQSAQSWVYGGNTITFKDEAGNQWQNASDGLGRVTRVLEPNGTSAAPSMETDYQYDPQNNLLSVKQWGGPNGSPAPNGPLLRTFTYDSLSRLLSATNPESGKITYSYDANGNLLSKTTPAPNAPAASTQTVMTSYTYDALNRVTGKAFGSYAYAYQYDTSGSLFTSSYAIGRLTEAFNQSNASEQFSYDPLGRVVWEAHTLPDSCCGTAAEATSNAVSASYDLAGDITSLTYPDTRVVTQSWNAAGQLTSVNFSSYNSGYAVNYPYLASASYFPNGSPQSMTFGNGVVDTVSANNRLQLTEISLQATANLNQKIFDKLFCYGPATTVCPVRGTGYDNGNIWAIADGQNSNRSISAYYDTLNRISSFNNGNNSMVQTYAIDPFGNMNQTSPGTSQSNLSFNGNNQISTSGFIYDAAGNLIQANLGAGIYQYLSYDPESKLTNLNNGAATYTYDAEGAASARTSGAHGRNTSISMASRSPRRTPTALGRTTSSPTGRESRVRTLTMRVFTCRERLPEVRWHPGRSAWETTMSSSPATSSVCASTSRTGMVALTSSFWTAPRPMEYSQTVRVSR